MSIAPLVALGTLVFTVVNFLKYLTGRNWNGVVTQAIAWVAGVVAVLLFAHTAFAVAVVVNGLKLSQLNFWSQVFLGLMATSLLSTTNEALKAIDTHQSQAKPNLLPTAVVETHAADPVMTPTKPARPRRTALKAGERKPRNI